MRGGSSQTYPSFPAIEASLGYNPARFLDHPADAQDTIGDTSELATAEAMIRGLDDIETVRLWIDVEIALGRGPDGKPRAEVTEWLYQRRAQLDGDTDTQSNETPSDHEAADDEPHADAGDDTDETPEPPAEPPAPAVSDADEAVTAEPSVAADGGTTTEETSVCAVCHTELTREEIAGKVGYWCPECRDFQEPVMPEGSA